jgi:phage minor structural protein
MMAGAFLFDNDINLIASIEENKLIENYQESELGSSIIGYCSLPFHLFIEDSKYFGVKDDDNFFLYRIIKTVRKKNEISITGIHIFFDELNTRIVKDLRPKNKTASFILSEILKDTDWKVGLSDIDTLGSKSFYYQSCLSAFYEVIKLFDCEFKLRINFTNGKIVDKRVDLIKSIKLDYGRWFELGDKLLSVEAESNDGEVFTAFVGRGKGIEVTDENGNSTGGYSRKITFKDIGWGKPNDPLNKPVGSERLVFDNMVNIYGYREAVVDFEDIEDPKKLLEKTYEYGLEHSRPRVQLKAKAVGEHVRLGEICTIINDKLKIRYKTRVFKLKIDHLCKDKIEFEFGDKIKTSVADRLSAQSEDLKKSKESIEKGLESFKRQVGNQIINSYFNEDGYNYEFKADNKYNLPAGLYSFDKPIEMNPTKVIYFGAGKIMIANRKTNDGNWDWSTFGTGDGFVADYITAGILQGGKVRWNLEDGTFLIGNSISDYSFYWDGSTLHMKDVDIDLTNNSVVKNMNQNIDKNNEDIKKANDVISQTQTSVQVLKDSISSKVSKTEILSDNELREALKCRDGVGIKKIVVETAYSTDDVAPTNGWEEVL